MKGNFHGCAPLLVKVVFFQDTEPAGKTEEEIWRDSGGTVAAEGFPAGMPGKKIILELLLGVR